MKLPDFRERILAAQQLLGEDTTSLGKIESLTTLLRGFDPKVDKLLSSLVKTASNLQKFQKGELIELTAENLPEQTEEEKERKRRIIAFLRFWNELKNEVERIKGELEAEGQEISTLEKVTSFTKGPFGIITLLAVLIVGVFLFTNANKSQTSPPSPKPKIQVLIFGDKKIPLTELIVGTGPECLTNTNQAPHYHAKDHTAAKALDGAMITDPGGCGYGKVSEAVIEEVEIL